MKTILAILVIVALGIGLGIGLAKLRLENAKCKPIVDEHGDGAADAPAAGEKPVPQAVIETTKYDFGTLDMAGSGSHDFVVTNNGTGPLTLSGGGTSCRCAVSKLEREKTLPGQSAKITVKWKSGNMLGPYRQTVNILTNDPARREIALTITGRITVAAQVTPAELVFSQVPPGGTQTAKAVLLGFYDERLKVLGHEWSDADTAQYFDVAIEPIAADKLPKATPPARCGCSVAVTVKPGLPQGQIHQVLVLKTNIASVAALALPIQGIVGYGVAVVGPGWDARAGALNLGAVDPIAGLKWRLLLVVRDPAGKPVAFKIASVEPSVLKASLGEPTDVNGGAVVQTPLFIEVPPGSPAGDHLGSDRGHPGEINIETTHPQVPKLRILVRFAVEE